MATNAPGAGRPAAAPAKAPAAAPAKAPAAAPGAKAPAPAPKPAAGKPEEPEVPVAQPPPGDPESWTEEQRYPFSGDWIKKGAENKFQIDKKNVRFLESGEVFKFRTLDSRVECFMELKDGLKVEGKLHVDGSIHWSNKSIWVRDEAPNPFVGLWKKAGGLPRFEVVGKQVVFKDDGGSYAFKDLGDGACTMNLKSKTVEGQLYADGKLRWANGSIWERDPGFDGTWCKVGTLIKYIIKKKQVKFLADGSVKEFQDLRDGSCTMNLNGSVFKGKMDEQDRIAWPNGSFWKRDDGYGVVKRPSRLTIAFDGRWQTVGKDISFRYNLMGDRVQQLSDMVIGTFTRNPDSTCAMQIPGSDVRKGRMTGEGCIEWEDGDVWSKEVTKAPVQVVPSHPIKPTQVWAPEAKEFQEKEFLKNQVKSVHGRAALKKGRRRALRNWKDLKGLELREIDPTEIRSDTDADELSDVDSMSSTDSITGMVSRSWEPVHRDERYRFARDKAIGFSEDWAPLEWDHERWFHHLNGNGTLDPNAVIMPPAPAAVKKIKTSEFDGHWQKAGTSVIYVVEGEKVHMSNNPEGGLLALHGSRECELISTNKSTMGRWEVKGGKKVIEWANGLEWHSTEGFDGYWVKQSKETSKYIIQGPYLELADLQLTTPFISAGFSCQYEVNGTICRGQLNGGGSITFEHGGVWIRDPAAKAESKMTEEEREAEMEARLKRERDAKINERKVGEAKEKIVEAMSKIEELRPVEIPELDATRLVSSANLCAEFSDFQSNWEAAQAKLNPPKIKSKPVPPRCFGDPPNAQKMGYGTWQPPVAISSSPGIAWPADPCYPPAWPSSPVKKQMEPCPWRDYCNENAGKMWL